MTRYHQQPDQFVLFELTAGVTDEDLDEAERIVWQGYVPPAYVSVVPPGELWARVRGEVPRRHDQAPDLARHRQRRLRDRGKIRAADVQAPGMERPSMLRLKGFSQFRCAHCKRWFLTETDEATAEAEYQAAQAAAGVEAVPVEDRLTLCEPCYDRVVARLSGAAA
jgi:hypothetical protein